MVRASAATGKPFSNSSSGQALSSSNLGHKQNRCHSRVLRRGFGKDTVEGWIDLSKLVSGSGGIKTAYEDLSYKIGTALQSHRMDATHVSVCIHTFG